MASRNAVERTPEPFGRGRCVGTRWFIPPHVEHLRRESAPPEKRRDRLNKSAQRDEGYAEHLRIERNRIDLVRLLLGRLDASFDRCGPLFGVGPQRVDAPRQVVGLSRDRIPHLLDTFLKSLKARLNRERPSRP